MDKICWLVTLMLCVTINTLNAQEADELRHLDSLLAIEYKDKPGITVLAARDGEIVFRKSYGLANLTSGHALSPDMIFEIGSMTKQFTSAAILQLAEAGKVSLDDPIQKYVPFFPEKEYPINLHHLLSQTSGIPEFFDVDEAEFSLLSKVHTPRQLIAYYEDLPLNFVPGTQFEYSNSNYPLLGVVIETVSGLPLSAYFQRYLFDPLGMERTSLWYQATGDEAIAVPQGYRRKSQNKLVTSPEIDGSTVYAAGGIVSTVDDLYRWNRELADPKHLSKKLVRTLTKENRTSNNAKTGYGYGFFIEDFQSHRAIQHGGNMYGFTSTALYVPKQDVYVCVVANMAFENTKNIAKYIAGLLINKAIPYFRQLDPAKVIQYLGKYRLTDTDMERDVEIKLYEGQLLLHFPEDPASDVVLYNTEADTFRSSQIALELRFKRDVQGDIRSFRAIQRGEFEFLRVE